MKEDELLAFGTGLQHLRSLLRDGADCPHCKYDQVKYGKPMNDWPGFELHSLVCTQCGLVVQWEERDDPATGDRKIVVVDAVVDAVVVPGA